MKKPPVRLLFVISRRPVLTLDLTQPRHVRFHLYDHALLWVCVGDVGQLCGFICSKGLE